MSDPPVARPSAETTLFGRPQWDYSPGNFLPKDAQQETSGVVSANITEIWVGRH